MHENNPKVVSNRKIDDENVSFEESSKRLILLGLVFGFLLASVSTFLAWEYRQKVSIEEKIYGRAISNQKLIDKPLNSIVLLTSNNKVIQVSLKDRQIQEQSQLFQLPSKKKYYIFKPRFNVLNFVTEDLNIDFIEFQADGKHSKIPKSALPKKVENDLFHFQSEPDANSLYETDLFFENAIQVGDKVWFTNANFKWGQIHTSFSQESEFKATLIWYMKRQKWGKGPIIPKFAQFYHGCYAALNYSSVVLIGGDSVEMESVDAFDLETLNWSSFPRIPMDNFWPFSRCSAILHHGKFYQKNLIVSMITLTPMQSISSYAYKTVFLSHQIGKNQEWTIHEGSPHRMENYHHLLIFHGMLVTILENHENSTAGLIIGPDLSQIELSWTTQPKNITAAIFF